MGETAPLPALSPRFRDDDPKDGADSVAFDTTDETASIASSSTKKKPIYTRAFRKVYKTLTAPEKDGSGARISIRESISKRLSKDPSVSSSSSSFLFGGRTPPSARYQPPPGLEVSGTNTAPLPKQGSGVPDTPVQASLSYDPARIPQTLPLDVPPQEPVQHLDSARELYKGADAPQSLPSPVVRAPAPSGSTAVSKADMSLAELARTAPAGEMSDNTVTPMTSARDYGAEKDAPHEPMDAPAPAPQLSAASLVREGKDDELAEAHVTELSGDSAMSKRPHDTPSQYEPESKEEGGEKSKRHIFMSPTKPAADDIAVTGEEGQDVRGKKKKGGLGRFVRRVVVLGALGAITTVAVQRTRA